MTYKFIEKLRASFSSETRPQLPLAQVEPKSKAAEPREIPTPRGILRNSVSSSLPSRKSSAASASDTMLDAAHSPPSVLTQHLGPPKIEHNYPQDSKFRRHSISAQEQHYLR